MIGDVKRKAILEFEADLSDLDLAFEQAESKAAELKRQTMDVAKALDAVSLKAPKVGLLGKAFGAFDSAVTKASRGVAGGVGAIDGFAKKLAPWNQAVELGGKVLGAMSAGLDEVAKGSGLAAKEAKALQAEFEGWQNSAKYGLGIVTLELGKQALFADDIKKKFIEIEQTKFFKAFGLKAGADGKLELMGGIFRGDDEANNSTFDPKKFDAFRDSIEINYISKLEQAKKKYDELAAAAKRAADEDAKFAKGFLEAQLNQKRNNTDTRPGHEAPTFSISTGMIDSQGAINSAHSANTAEQRYAGSAGRRNKSLLDSLGIGGDEVSKLELVKTALGSFKDAYAETVQAIASGSMSAGEAFKKGIGMIMNAVGQKLAGMAVGELFEAGANLFLGNPVGAARHAGAAAIYTAGAAALFGIGAKLGGGGSKPSTGAPAAGGTRPGLSLGGGSSGGGGGGERVIVFVGSAFSRDTPRMRQIQANQAVDEAFGAIGARNR